MHRTPNRRTRPALEALEAKQLLAAFAVTTAADSGPGSFRQAILDADADADAASGVDSIDFAIPGGGVQTIAPATPLPTLTRPTVVDATTQPGYAGSPLVVLDGTGTVAPGGGPATGLDIAVADDETGTAVRGLGVIHFGGTALAIDAAAATVSDVVIGINPADGQPAGNGGYGILFGVHGGNSVADSSIANSGLRAIGGVEDRPGVATPSDVYTTSDIAAANNDLDGTQLVVSTPDGALAAESTTFGGLPTATFTVTNTGAHAATDVQVALDQDPYSKTLTITQAAASQGTVALIADEHGDYPAAVDLGTLAPGASATITLTIRYTTGSVFAGSGSITAIATAPQVDYLAATTAATYQIKANPSGQPAHGLTVFTPQGQEDAEFVQWGSLIPMTYTVTNTGTEPATGVTLNLMQATYSHLLTIVSATTTQGSIDPGLDFAEPPQSLATIGTLAPGASATVTVLARVGSEADNPPDPSGGTGDYISAVAYSPDVPREDLFIPTAYSLTPDPDLTGSSVDAPVDATSDGPGGGGGESNGGPDDGTDGGSTAGGQGDDGSTSTVAPGESSTGTAAGTSTATAPATTTGGVVYGDGVPYGDDGLAVVAPQAPADLAISTALPVVPRVGTPGLFVLTVRNAGEVGAGAARVALDLSGMPAGTYYAIASQTAAGGAGTLAPVPGRPGVYFVDLGAMGVGSSATVAVLVQPGATGPIGLTAAVADAGFAVPDPDPADNFTGMGVYVTPSVQVTTADMAASGTIRLNLDSAVPAAQAEDLAHYRLTTGGATARPVRLRSATADASGRAVTLTPAQAVPRAASRYRLTIGGLGPAADGSATTLDLERA